LIRRTIAGSPWRCPTRARRTTEPHYNGFPAVLVRLPEIEVEELEELILDAWRCQAPRALVEEAFDEGERRAIRDPGA